MPSVSPGVSQTMANISAETGTPILFISLAASLRKPDIASALGIGFSRNQLHFFLLREILHNQLYLVKPFFTASFAMSYCISRPLCYMGLSTLYFRFPPYRSVLAFYGKVHSLSCQIVILKQTILPITYILLSCKSFITSSTLYNSWYAPIFLHSPLGSIIDFSVLFTSRTTVFSSVVLIRFTSLSINFLFPAESRDIQAFYLYRFSSGRGLDRLSSSLLFRCHFHYYRSHLVKVLYLNILIVINFPIILFKPSL